MQWTLALAKKWLEVEPKPWAGTSSTDWHTAYSLVEWLVKQLEYEAQVSETLRNEIAEYRLILEEGR